VLCCRIHWAVTNKLCSFLLHFKTFFQNPKNVTHIFQLSRTFFIHWLCTGFVDALCISSVYHRVEVIFIHYRMPCCTCYCCVVSAYFSAMYAVLCWSCVFVHMWLLACSNTGTLCPLVFQECMLRSLSLFTVSLPSRLLLDGEHLPKIYDVKLMCGVLSLHYTVNSLLYHTEMSDGSWKHFWQVLDLLSNDACYSTVNGR